MERISFSKFVKDVSKYTGFTQKNIREVLEACEATMIEHLKKDESVKVMPTVSISTGIHSARKGYNPRTGESIEIPESKMLKAKFSASLKEAVNI